MPFLAKSLTALGGLLLAHACYSAHEHSSLLALRPSSPSLHTTSISTTASLPLDITLETIVSVLVICVGLVWGAEALKPISWRVWAGGVEREKAMGRGGAGPYEGLEARVGFWDVRASRREFADWVREGGVAAKG
ncbi:MAG: hypothetical protein FRX48_05288 [Lasallia pustulata]|nr:MAG: hypothetical protein FRX48_05288 [Lasallia pustulata]